MKLKWSAIWFAVNALLLVVPPAVAFYTEQSNLAHSHPPIPRFNSDGDDALGIPVEFALFQIICGLFLLNVIGFCVWWIYKRRRN